MLSCLSDFVYQFWGLIFATCKHNFVFLTFLDFLLSDANMEELPKLNL